MEPSPNRYQIQKLRPAHLALIDLIVAQPNAGREAWAAQLGFSKEYITILMATDLFREALAARRAEMWDPEVHATVKERFHAITVRSLEILHSKLAGPEELVSDNLALRAAELGAKAGGLMDRQPAVVVVQPDPARLENLAQRLVALNQRRPANVEDAVEVQASEARPPADPNREACGPADPRRERSSS